MPDFAFEDEIGGLVAGVDEAGRGPWAGPVVAAAVILDRENLSDALRNGLDDSKKLSKKKREALFDYVKTEAVVGIGIADVDEIDRHNILQATWMAMGRAVENLAQRPTAILVDGNRGPKFAVPSRCIVKGDGLSLSIAAASIIAKVTRDRIMADLAARYPGYGWERNAGYGTKEHQLALKRLGVNSEHRRSFAPISKMLSRSDSGLLDIE